jgi:hypothetical protein
LGGDQFLNWQGRHNISADPDHVGHGRQILNPAASGPKGAREMSEQDNAEVIKRGYEAFSAGDVEAVMNSFDDDIEWIQPGASAISGTYHGKSEVMEYLGRLAEKSVTVKVERLVSDGDTVVALTHITMGDEVATTPMYSLCATARPSGSKSTVTPR